MNLSAFKIHRNVIENNGIFEFFYCMLNANNIIIQA